MKPSALIKSIVSSTVIIVSCPSPCGQTIKRPLVDGGLTLVHCVTSSYGSPSRGGDVAIYVFDINQPSLPTPSYSVLKSVSVFKALSTVFHSINSPDNSPLSHSVLLVLYLPCWFY